MRRRVIRTWPIKPPLAGKLKIEVPLIHPKGIVLKAWGKRSGHLYVLDEPARHLADLDETEHFAEVILVEQTTSDFQETHLPESAGKCIGAFWDEGANCGFFVFIARKDAPTSGRTQRR